MNTNMRTFIKISMINSSLFILLLILLHLIKTEINPSWQPISEYALGNYGWVMRLAFFTMMIATATAAFASFNTFKTIGGKIGGVLLVLSSVGFFLAGIFNTDPATLTGEDVTTSGTIHSIGAGLAGMVVFSSLFFLWQVYQNPLLNENRKLLTWATILLWVSEIVLIISMAIYLPKNEGNLGPEVLVGWQNRFMILCCALWLIAFMKQIRKVKV